ncbi:MAG: glycosyltransferase family 2 protein [Oligoflexales bacterium]|nr:glycosyltransferase family 2 protein [Oligoflexales bacterium]
MVARNLVVIPAHNEEETIYEVVTKALKYADVSVTDDGSRDKTPLILAKILKECEEGRHKHNLNVITHESATHIPKGIQDGFKFAVENDYDFVVTMDSGLSHDPDALPDFFSQDPSIDVVIGRRKSTKNVPFYRRTVSFFASIVVNYALSDSYVGFKGYWIRDCTSGFRRYSRRVVGRMASSKLNSKSFDFHMEAISICCRSRATLSEIPITYLFSNSSFNRKVLIQGIKFGLYLMKTKFSGVDSAENFSLTPLNQSFNQNSHDRIH